MSEITLEQVEKITARVNVTYEEARGALEHTGGDTLEAIIYLERMGKTISPSPAPEGGGAAAAQEAEATPPTQGTGGFYSTRTGAFSAPQNLPAHTPAKDGEGSGTPRGFFEALWAILRNCVANQFEVWRRGEVMVSAPVVILVLLVLVAFRLTIPLLFIGLLFGCRYRFAGPNVKEDNAVNRIMTQGHDWIDKQVEEVKRKAGEGKKK